MTSPIYDFVCDDINSEPVKLSEFEGKVLLIVNTASFCGFTPQYKGLEQLFRDYKDKGLVILGFPSNQFGEEPHDNESINNYCLLNYNITFPMFSKIKINGPDEHPLYYFLKKEKTGIFGMEKIKYNFTKFLVDRQGNVVKRYSPLVFPSSLRKKIDEII